MMARVRMVVPVAAGFVVLLALLLMGRALERVLPLPAPLIGMVLLAGLIATTHGMPAQAGVACGKHLLAHYALFFVPAGVGVLDQAGALRVAWLPVTVSLVFSSVLSLVVTALVMRLSLRWRHG